MIKRPDEYGHNNPDYAMVDAGAVRGGGRVAANLTALYAIPLDLLKERVTKVYVTSEAKYYVLKDIANAGNVNGWEVDSSGGGDVVVDANAVDDALATYAIENAPDEANTYIPLLGKIRISLETLRDKWAQTFGAVFAAKTHAHAQSDITGLSTALAGKQDVLGFTPEQAGVAATLISNLKNGVSSEGDTLKKLYDLIVASYSEVTVATTAARNAYNVTKLPTNIFVTDDGDGKWALYKCISTGINRGNDVKISDPDLLNAVMTASQIKTAYESNADTNAFTNALLAKLNAFTATFTSELKTAYDAAVTAAHSHSNKTILDAIQVAYTTTMNNKLAGIADNANNYVHPTGDGNLHVPPTNGVTANKVLTNKTPGSAPTWEEPAAAGAVIDDGVVVNNKTWSSEKTDSERKYKSENINSPTSGSITLKNSTETVLNNPLTNANNFSVVLPTPIAGKVNESILIFSIGATLPTITLPTIQLTGTIDDGSATTTLTGTGTLFLSELSIGDLIYVPGSGTVKVVSIASDVQSTIDVGFSSSPTGSVAFYRAISYRGSSLNLAIKNTYTLCFEQIYRDNHWSIICTAIKHV